MQGRQQWVTVGSQWATLNGGIRADNWSLGQMGHQNLKGHHGHVGRESVRMTSGVGWPIWRMTHWPIVSFDINMGLYLRNDLLRKR